MMETSVRESLLQAMVALASSNAVGNAKEIGAIAIAVNKIDALEKQNAFAQAFARVSPVTIEKPEVAIPSKQEALAFPSEAVRGPRLKIADRVKCVPLDEEVIAKIEAQNKIIDICKVIKTHAESFDGHGFFFEPYHFTAKQIQRIFNSMYSDCDIQVSVSNNRTLFVLTHKKKGL